MTKNGQWRWLFPWALVGCNAVFGIHRHDYKEELSPPDGSGGASGQAGAESSAAAPAAEDDTFLALWSFESLDDGQTLSSSDPALPLTTQQGTLAAGPTGNHLVLAGAGSAVARGPLIDASESFSISVWVKLDGLEGWDTVVSQEGEAISSFYLQKRNSNDWAFTTYALDDPGAEPCTAVASLRPRPGEWYHLVASREGTTGEQRIYVDGMLSGTATCAGGFRTTGPLVVGRGRWRTPTDWTDGAIDELGIAQRALSPEEIIDLYRLGRPNARHYLFAYFTEVDAGQGDGLRFAHSHDGLAWNPIGAGRLFLSPTVGGRSFRDPHLMRAPDGTYHLVWTSSCVPWAAPGCVQDRGFGHATSADLAAFSAQDFIEVPREKLDAEHFWAPETFYDAAEARYLLTWSSPVDLTPDADPHAIYYSTTNDFVTFSDPAVFYSREGRNLIDATIVPHDGTYLMFLKDEAEGQKNVRLVSSPRLLGDGAWPGDPSAPLTGPEPAEGPAVLAQEEGLLLLFDRYAAGTLGAAHLERPLDPNDAAQWEDVSASVSAPWLRHGSAIEVPFEVLKAVALRAAR